MREIKPMMDFVHHLTPMMMILTMMMIMTIKMTRMRMRVGVPIGFDEVMFCRRDPATSLSTLSCTHWKSLIIPLLISIISMLLFSVVLMRLAIDIVWNMAMLHKVLKMSVRSNWVMLVMMLILFVCSALSYFISHSTNIKFCVLQSLRAQMFFIGHRKFYSS